MEIDIHACGLDLRVEVVDGSAGRLQRLLARFPAVRADAAETFSPALIANYCYEVAKGFNQFYHDHSILNEPDEKARDFRLVLTLKTGEVLRNAMSLLGIEMPERM